MNLQEMTTQELAVICNAVRGLIYEGMDETNDFNTKDEEAVLAKIRTLRPDVVAYEEKEAAAFVAQFDTTFKPRTLGQLLADKINERTPNGNICQRCGGAVLLCRCPDVD
jgi:hypothetical protein